MNLARESAGSSAVYKAAQRRKRAVLQQSIGGGPLAGVWALAGSTRTTHDEPHVLPACCLLILTCNPPQPCATLLAPLQSPHTDTDPSPGGANLELHEPLGWRQRRRQGQQGRVESA